VLQANPFDLVKDFWVESRVAVADCFGIQRQNTLAGWLMK
jgi:hypothetical protein